MSRVRSLLTMDAMPVRQDLALLILRVWMAGGLAALHGWGKIERLSADPVKFADPFGMGPEMSLMLAVLAEVGGALLVAIGLGTRWVALAIIFTLGTAFFTAHHGALTGQGNGELPFVYMAGFVALFVAGPGRFSVDARLR
ncbi:DoxX family protein [Gemmatimonas sp.]|uniref:DoxX family protein n=1 Tax=Gemmatimonas sp. TaxID=1962908 RepID=UPI00286AF1F1|nr:DoxX family protein [Gemmatimonas sp.]